MMSSISRKLQASKLGIFLDLETCFLGKVTHRRPGQKRYETRILEIGAVSMQTSDTFNVLVNPLYHVANIDCAKDFYTALKSIHQHPFKTLRFWIGILHRRGEIDKTWLKRRPDDMAIYIVQRMKVSKQILENWKDSHKEPLDNVAKRQWAQQCIEELDNVMVEPRIALLGLEQMTVDHGNVWYAHNGGPFDFKVLYGAYERTDLAWPPLNTKCVDTIPLFKKWTKKSFLSYSQPRIYFSLFQRTYNAHIALDDAKALKEIFAILSLKPVSKTEATAKSESKSVRSLRGVGEITERRLQVQGIYTIDDLKTKCNGSLKWLQDNVGKRWAKTILEQLQK